MTNINWVRSLTTEQLLEQREMLLRDPRGASGAVGMKLIRVLDELERRMKLPEKP